ncbi:MAG: hypothetical protein JWQ08_2352 [Deinococcus sp.]|nr:hypothetical protein [Deinococcus sp.]
MGRAVAESWLSNAWSSVQDQSHPQLRSQISRCERETGWTLARWSATPTDENLIVFTLQAPHRGLRVELRFHWPVPVVGCVSADALDASLDEWASSWVAWGHEYINPAPLVAWWQAAGWIVPDAAWLNGQPNSEDLALLNMDNDATRKSWRSRSRGDCIFFDFEN